MPRQPIDALNWVSVETDLKAMYSSEGFDSPITLDRADKRNIWNNGKSLTRQSTLYGGVKRKSEVNVRQ